MCYNCEVKNSFSIGMFSSRKQLQPKMSDNFDYLSDSTLKYVHTIPFSLLYHQQPRNKNALHIFSIAPNLLKYEMAKTVAISFFCCRVIFVKLFNGIK